MRSITREKAPMADDRIEHINALKCARMIREKAKEMGLPDVVNASTSEIIAILDELLPRKFGSRINRSSLPKR